MCIYKSKNNDKCKMINRSKLGDALKGVITEARNEHRLICGLLPAIACLEEIPDDVLLCVLPPTKPGDATTHMQVVLLQAFCYENFIPVIQVDSNEKLAEYCGLPRKSECTCAVITTNSNIDSKQSPPLSPSEQELADFYECTLEEFPRPIVELPR